MDHGEWERERRSQCRQAVDVKILLRNTRTGLIAGVGKLRAHPPPYIEGQQGLEKCLVCDGVGHWRGSGLVLQDKKRGRLAHIIREVVHWGQQVGDGELMRMYKSGSNIR